MFIIHKNGPSVINIRSDITSILYFGKIFLWTILSQYKHFNSKKRLVFYISYVYTGIDAWDDQNSSPFQIADLENWLPERNDFFV